MALIKTPQEIEALKRGGKQLSQILRELHKACVPGVSTETLDRIARERMASFGATPSFLGYCAHGEATPFPGAVCISINEEVVHGLPIPGRTIKSGDVVGLDIGMWYEGLATDMATTVMVGGEEAVDPKVVELVKSTRQALVEGIGAVRTGKWIHDIGNAIEDYLKPKKYGIVRDMVGHGVGHAVHEDPQIPHFRDRHAPRVKMQTGMVLAIEPMVNLGTWQIDLKRDGWTIVTADKQPSAHFELTITVTPEGYELITPWPDQE